MERNEKIQNVNIVEVIKVELIRGYGEKGDPVRKVFQYWDLKGNLINDDDIYLDPCNTSSAVSESNFKDIQ